MTKLQITVEELFGYLESAVFSIPKKYRKIAFQSLAYKLIQWNGISPKVIRDALENCSENLEGICVGCFNELVDSTSEEPLCEECSEKYQD